VGHRLVFWALERDDRFVRFHAAQAVIAFGALSVIIVALGGLGAVSLSFLPAAFMPLLVAAFMTWLAGLGLWLLVMWKAASGEMFRIPLAAGWADRLGNL